MENSFNVFTETLTELMENEQMGIPQLSEALHCDKAAIRRWFYNRYLPAPETVIKIAELFNVSADYLFGLSDKKDFVKNISENTFYERYTRLREEQGYNDYYISRECKIRDSAISKWKAIEQFPSIISMLKLCECLHCSLEYLLGRSLA